VNLTFTKNETTRVEIDRDNLIRRIVMQFEIALDTPAAMTAGTVAIEDDILNAVKKIRLVMDADDNKFNVDLTKWLIVEQIEKGTIPKRDALTIPAAGASATMTIVINADFAIFRQQLSDIQALLDAPNKSSLFLEVDWGDITDILGTPADTVILAASTLVRINLVEVFDDEGAEANAQLAAQQFTDLREGTEAFDVTAAKTSFDDSIQQEDVDPTPSRIRTHMFLTKEDITSVSGTPVRANDVITQLKVENVKGNGEKILQTRFDIGHFNNKSEYGLESIFTGAYYVDWVDQRRGGLANFVADALKLRFLTNAPIATETDEIQLYKRYISGVAQ